jgi:hypothetical protein
MDAGGLVQWWTDTRIGSDTIQLAHAFLAQRVWSQCGQWRRVDFEPAACGTSRNPGGLRCRLCTRWTTGTPGRAVCWRRVDGDGAVHAFAGGDLSLCTGHPADLAGTVAIDPGARCAGCRWVLIQIRVEEMHCEMFELPKRTRCGCDVEIVFVKTVANRVMPIDAEPHPAGSVRLTWQGRRATAHVMSTEELHTYTGRRYIAHMATCRVTEYYRRSFRHNLYGDNH